MKCLLFRTAGLAVLVVLGAWQVARAAEQGTANADWGQAVVERAGRESPVTPDPPETETGRILRRTYNFQEAGKEMEYALYVPKNYDGTKDTPLIVALHGLYSSPRQILSYPGFTRRTEKYGCLLVAPMGYNTRGWYGSRGPAGGRRGDPKNLGELSEKDVLNVLELVCREFKIDDRRIYFFGHSMGDGGALHLAIKYPDVWAGMALIAPVAYGGRDRLERANH